MKDLMQEPVNLQRVQIQIDALLISLSSWVYPAP